MLKSYATEYLFRVPG